MWNVGILPYLAGPFLFPWLQLVSIQHTEHCHQREKKSKSMTGFTNMKEYMLSLYMAQSPGCREGMTSGLFAKVRKFWGASGRDQVPVCSHGRLSSQHGNMLPGCRWPHGQKLKISWLSNKICLYTAPRVLYLQMGLNCHFVNSELLFYKPEVSAYKLRE